MPANTHGGRNSHPNAQSRPKFITTHNFPAFKPAIKSSNFITILSQPIHKPAIKSRNHSNLHRTPIKSSTSIHNQSRIHTPQTPYTRSQILIRPYKHFSPHSNVKPSDNHQNEAVRTPFANSTPQTLTNDNSRTTSTPRPAAQVQVGRNAGRQPVHQPDGSRSNPKQTGSFISFISFRLRTVLALNRL